MPIQILMLTPINITLPLREGQNLQSEFWGGDVMIPPAKITA